jgi:competence protein ComFC
MAEAARVLRSAPSLVSALMRSAFSLLVPALCVACGRRLTVADRWVCPDCRFELCGLFSPGRRVIGLPGGRRLVVRFAFRYHPLVSKVITEMKYGDKPGMSGLLAPFAVPLVAGRVDTDDILVPVPMHPSRRRERGYNQSGLLGKDLSRLTGLETRSDILVKRRSTPSQTALEHADRLRSVAGSIDAGPGGYVRGRSFILVDDVVTTGSTLRECAGALEDRGAGEIWACVIASS